MNSYKKKVYFKEVPAFISKIVDHLKIHVNIMQIKDMYSLNYPSIYSYEEERVRGYIDCYLYLLNNVNNFINYKILSKSYFLLTMKRINQKKFINILSEFLFIKEDMSINKIIDFSIKTSDLVGNKKDAYVYLLMLINYLLIHFNYKAIKYYPHEFKDLDRNIKEYKQGNKKPLYEFIIFKERTSKELPDNYYENLKEITLGEIVSFIKENKEIFIKKYKIESLAIFGSFVKEKARLDSDIDLIIRFQDFIPLLRQNSFIDEIKEIIFEKFNRFADIHIERDLLCEHDIKIFKDNIKII